MMLAMLDNVNKLSKKIFILVTINNKILLNP